ncbi:hypothetical protein GT348_07250 [Aristophania vespae]|uniref:Phage tail assembly protein n=1 Tax=Aristophania vespae TaxID=2697033 RepID=A0A6P1NEU5_9PROT|nr:phage tail assembly protein [Aristophania vespae]QHI96059.1 hypothetical protein GT348_07250 [Aristophania vespae]UMM63826.1 hypothetical protein DM15PD_08030 [Aristophania vespae]
MSETDLPKGAELQEDGSVQYTLSRPISMAVKGGTTRELSELTFSELVAGDLIDSSTSGSGAKISLDMLKRSTGLNDLVGEKLLRSLPARDYMRCQKIIAYFLEDGETTGT